MASLRIDPEVWPRVKSHLMAGTAERFGFMLARVGGDPGSPVFLADEFTEIPDDSLVWAPGGPEVPFELVLDVVNQANRTGRAVVEAHSHRGTDPRFSGTDRAGLREIVPYMLDSVRGRPYVATVWGDDEVWGEWFRTERSSEGRLLRSILVAGTEQLHQLSCVVGRRSRGQDKYARQSLWLGPAAQHTLPRLRVAIVGLGGTGSHVVQLLAHLGCGEFVLVDPDLVEVSNLSRLIGSRPEDVGQPKVDVAARLVRGIAPGVAVQTIRGSVREAEALGAVRDADIVFGCVDTDGARLVLNELALAYKLAYIDLGVGLVVTNGSLVEAGGRVAVVTPAGPCLWCLGEIDPTEARDRLASPEERIFARQRGYIANYDAPAPAVVSLNGQVASAAVNELLVWLAGVRPPSALTQFDLIGSTRPLAGAWLAPLRVSGRDPNCVACLARGLGDESHVERYATAEDLGHGEHSEEISSASG